MALQRLVAPRSADVGLPVLRLLPRTGQRSVGPFVFLDHFGPMVPPPGKGDVLSHPHIGLATVTSLFSGELLHKDSLGSVQPIVAGDLNWMSAGRGIVHAERVAEAARALGGEPLDGPRHMWWNFVSSDPQRIEAARQAWKDDAFGKVPGETERVPAPEH